MYHGIFNCLNIKNNWQKFSLFSRNPHYSAYNILLFGLYHKVKMFILHWCNFFQLSHSVQYSMKMAALVIRIFYAISLRLDIWDPQNSFLCVWGIKRLWWEKRVFLEKYFNEFHSLFSIWKKESWCRIQKSYLEKWSINKENLWWNEW